MQIIEYNNVINTEAAARLSSAEDLFSTLWSAAGLGATAALFFLTFGFTSPFWLLIVTVAGTSGGAVLGFVTRPRFPTKRGLRWFLKVFWEAAVLGALVGVAWILSTPSSLFANSMLMSVVAAWFAGVPAISRGDPQEEKFVNDELARGHPVFYAWFLGFTCAMWCGFSGEGLVFAWQKIVDGIPFTHPLVYDQPAFLGLLVGLIFGALLGTATGLRRTRRVRQQTESTDTLE